jgi:hypothetical protein
LKKADPGNGNGKYPKEGPHIIYKPRKISTKLGGPGNCKTARHKE